MADEGSTRLDAALAASGLARSRNHAAQLIAEGYVSIDGVVTVKPSARVRDGQALHVDGDDSYVSRAAGKLVAALDAFDGIEVSGRLALDAGASTGGFTQVLLERGARHVIAADVGHGQLSPVIATDARVSVVEGYNLRFATPDSLAAVSGVAEAPQLVVGDLSFISLTQVLPALVAVATSDADFVLLVKPQFEVGRSGIREGVVRNPGLRADAISTVLWAGFDLGLQTAGLIFSPVIGNAGNHEYLVWLSAGQGSNPTEWRDRVINVSGAHTP
ncbi:TlyA family RNA methyltransferase [Subtercola sp. YIM 133946]|uniref:TlyA family RNA methyltransferase n=1 Tax=Subtercola sp. YIM 133946 TaxID=3118909 RepID=UPI002F951C2E